MAQRRTNQVAVVFMPSAKDVDQIVGDSLRVGIQ
jgi:hypothetical protein